MLDPDRKVPQTVSCYRDSAKSAADCDRHPNWRHGTSWEEVSEYLDAGALVTDADGDRVYAIDRTSPGINDTSLQVSYGIRDGADLAYSHFHWQMLLENVQLIEPATPEEEDEAIASILGSIK